MKTFRVVTAAGTADAQQLATFAYYIGGKQYRFVVTRLPLCPVVVTHRDSGLKVREIPHATQAACPGNYVDAARSVLDALVAKVGADRVRHVIDTRVTKP